MLKISQIRSIAWLKAALGTVTCLSTMAIVAQPGQAHQGFRNPEDAYKLCGERLSAANIEKDLAAQACAEVLHPDHLGTCVLDITAREVNALTTLSACRRVRRPLELVTCVGDINAQDATANLPTVLEACRRSLMPERYGKCVVGLAKSLEVATVPGLNTCIDASDRPVDVLSTFIPLESLPRMEGFGSPSAAPETSGLSETSPGLQVPAAATPQLY